MKKSLTVKPKKFFQNFPVLYHHINIFIHYTNNVLNGKTDKLLPYCSFSNSWCGKILEIKFTFFSTDPTPIYCLFSIELEDTEEQKINK